MIDTILLVSFSGSNPYIWFKHEPEPFDTIRPWARLTILKGTTKVTVKLGRNFDRCKVTTYWGQVERSYHIHKVLPPTVI